MWQLRNNCININCGSVLSWWGSQTEWEKSYGVWPALECDWSLHLDLLSVAPLWLSSPFDVLYAMSLKPLFRLTSPLLKVVDVAVNADGDSCASGGRGAKVGVRRRTFASFFLPTGIMLPSSFVVKSHVVLHAWLTRFTTLENGRGCKPLQCCLYKKSQAAKPCEADQGISGPCTHKAVLSSGIRWLPPSLLSKLPLDNILPCWYLPYFFPLQIQACRYSLSPHHPPSPPPSHELTWQ